MHVYTIDCYWTMYARVQIKANSVQEAEKKAHEADLPKGEYVEDSFETYPQAEGDVRKDDSTESS